MGEGADEMNGKGGKIDENGAAPNSAQVIRQSHRHRSRSHIRRRRGPIMGSFRQFLSRSSNGCSRFLFNLVVVVVVIVFDVVVVVWFFFFFFR